MTPTNVDFNRACRRHQAAIFRNGDLGTSPFSGSSRSKGHLPDRLSDPEVIVPVREEEAEFEDHVGIYEAKTGQPVTVKPIASALAYDDAL